jgi:hypothetical protein
MSQSYRFDIFLSHSGKDKPQVQALAERLRDAGLRVWFDTWAIRPGDSIPDKIDEGLTQSAYVALCISAHSFESDWVGMEINTIIYQDPRNKKGRFIPIRLDNTEPRASLAPFLAIDWRTPTDSAFELMLSTFRPRPLPLPTFLQGPPDFAAFAQAWPHTRNGLQLDFVNAGEEPIHHANTAGSIHECDDFLLRLHIIKPLPTHKLVLLLQNADASYCQIYPNTLTPPLKMAAGKYLFPGNLLDLSTLAPEQQRLCFNTPGVEQVLGFLLPTLPDCILLRAPMAAINPNEIREILSALWNTADAAMASAAITVQTTQ